MAFSPSPVRNVLRVALSGVAAALIIIDEVARPVFRPIARAFGSLRIVAAAERLVARLPPYAILTCLIVPFALAEPLKLIALVWIGKGKLATGTVTLGAAYLASFLLVDRIYQAGRERLLSIGWFATIMSRLFAIREAVLGPIRRSHAWIAAVRIVRTAQARVLATLGWAPPP
jgi:hypothetical protein